MCIINAGKVVVVNVKLLYLTTVMTDIVWCGSSRTSCTPSLGASEKRPRQPDMATIKLK